MVAVPEPLYGVLEALSDLEGYVGTKPLVEQLIADYCSTNIMELRDDKHSEFYQCWTEIFDQKLSDDAIRTVCRL